MNVGLIDLPPTRVAYLRKIGPYGPAIGDFWRGVVRPWMLSHGLEHAECFGVGLDDPTITPPAKCRYDACVAVPVGFQAGGQAVLALARRPLRGSGLQRTAVADRRRLDDAVPRMAARQRAAMR